MIATFDVTNLFTIIPQEEGIQHSREALNKRTNPSLSTEFIFRLLEIVLSETIFQFSFKKYKQNVGKSMGSNTAPNFADIFMANIDNNIWKIIKELKESENIDVGNLNRVLDNLISIFIGTTKQLHKLWN